MKASVDIKCPECGKPMRLIPGDFGPFFACQQWPDCPGTHGATPEGKPLGIPATQTTKVARIRAHDAFDRMARTKQMTRSQAYLWLSNRLGISEASCHIGRFDERMCEEVVRLAEANTRAAPTSLLDLIAEKTAEKNDLIIRAQIEQAAGNSREANDLLYRSGKLESRITFLKAAAGHDDYHINAVSAVSCWMSCGATKRIQKFKRRAKRFGLRLKLEGALDA